MAATYRFVDREDDARKTYDARVKNKFKWEWLTEKDTHGDFLSSDIRKIDADGLSWCCFCQNVVNYSNSGKACFRSYASKSKVDQRERRLNKTNHQLPAAIQATRRQNFWECKTANAIIMDRPQILVYQDHLKNEGKSI